MAYFPLFVQLDKRPCLVVGGGTVAFRKIRVLLDFGADVTVVAPEITDAISGMPENIICHEKEYDTGDLYGFSLVVAATDDTELNHRISRDCRARGIMVNAVDQQEDCDFIVPAYLKAGEVVAAFSSGGNSPVVTQYLKKKNRDFVTPELGEITAYLGSIREAVKERVPTEAMRKRVYLHILEQWERTGQIPGEKEWETGIANQSSVRKGNEASGADKKTADE